MSDRPSGYDERYAGREPDPREFDREQPPPYPPGQAMQDFARLSMAMSRAGAELVVGASNIFGNALLNLTNSVLGANYPPPPPQGGPPPNPYNDPRYQQQQQRDPYPEEDAPRGDTSERI